MKGEVFPHQEKNNSPKVLLMVAFTAFLASCSPNRQTAIEKLLKNKSTTIECLTGVELAKLDSIKDNIVKRHLIDENDTVVEELGLKTNRYNHYYSEDYKEDSSSGQIARSLFQGTLSVLNLRNKIDYRNYPSSQARSEGVGILRMSLSQEKILDSSITKNMDIDNEIDYWVDSNGYVVISEETSIFPDDPETEKLGNFEIHTLKYVVIDPKTGAIINAWVTPNQPIKRENLPPAGEYIITENGEIKGDVNILKNAHNFINEKSDLFLNTYKQLQAIKNDAENE